MKFKIFKKKKPKKKKLSHKEKLIEDYKEGKYPKFENQKQNIEKKEEVKVENQDKSLGNKNIFNQDTISSPDTNSLGRINSHKVTSAAKYTSPPDTKEKQLSKRERRKRNKLKRIS